MTLRVIVHQTAEALIAIAIVVARGVTENYVCGGRGWGEVNKEREVSTVFSTTS